MRLFQHSVEIRQQAIAQLEIFANNVFVGFAEAPGFLIVAVNLLVIATEGRKETDLISARQKLAVAAPDESSDIAADESFTRKPQRLKHWTAQGARVPSARRV